MSHRLRQGFGAQVLASWLASPRPDAAVEIAPERVSAAALSGRGSSLRLQAYAAEVLPGGVVTARLASQNIHDRTVVAGAVRSVLERVAARPTRVALIVPDLVARVSLIRFERVPSRRDDLDQLVQWQVRKSAPFPIEEACVAYTPGRRGPAGVEFVTLVARRDVIQEYEQVCADAGVHAGVVDIATFSVLNLVLAGPGPAAGDWLLVHMRPESTSIAIVRDGDLIFFRSRPEEDEEPLADVVHQSAMYYQDRLAGAGFGRVLLGGSGRGAGALEQARHELEERLGMPVEAIDPTQAVALADRIGTSADLSAVLAPLTGMLLRAHSDGAPWRRGPDRCQEVVHA